MINIITAVVLMLVLLLLWEGMFTWICLELISLINLVANPYRFYHIFAFISCIVVMVVSATIGLAIIITYIKQSGI